MRVFTLDVRGSHLLGIKDLREQRHRYRAVTSYRKRVHNEIRHLVGVIRKLDREPPAPPIRIHVMGPIGAER